MTAKILVVDDEPDLEDLVRQKFRRQIKEGTIAFGFARDGEEALAFLAENPDFDMVVSDINMPRMDGLTLLARLQDEANRFSTVIVSAYGDMVNIRTAMNRGAFDFLTKPIDFADFETTVRKTIAHVADLRDARRRQAAAERAHASLSRYFSPNLARSLAADANALTPGGERREIATLFTDIAGFTPLVESLDPRELADLLSGYLEGMTEIVFAPPARSPSTRAPNTTAANGTRAASRSASRASGSMRDRRSSAISAAGGFLTTRLTATRSTPRRGSKRSTSSSARASASARSPPSKRKDFMAARSAISGCAAGANRCALTSRSLPKNLQVRRWRPMPKPSSSSKRMTQARSPPLPPF